MGTCIMAKKEKSNYIFQAVVHALTLLEEFSGDADELGVTKLSKRLKLHKNNIFRLLATLENKGYIEQNKITRDYRLGIKNLELGQTFIRQVGVLRRAHPVMGKLSKKLRENVYVGVGAGIAAGEEPVLVEDETSGDETSVPRSEFGLYSDLYYTYIRVYF